MSRKPMNVEQFITQAQQLIKQRPEIGKLPMYSGDTALVKAVKPYFGRLLVGKVVEHHEYRDALKVDLSADDKEANGVIIG